MATPIKYVPQKKNGTLLWVPVYKKGEGPSVPMTKPAQPVSKKVEIKKGTVPPGFLKRYKEEHKGVKKGVLTSTTCRICDKPFKYTKSKASMPRKLCSAECAYQAQKNFSKDYVTRKKKINTATKNAQPAVEKQAKKSFVERVAEHLPAPTLPVVEPVKDQPASKVVVPTWTALVEEAKELGVSLDKEPRKSQSFYIALLMARRAHHYKEWKELLSTQDCRIRQLPETFSALKSVSGTSAFAAAKALKVSMNM